MKKLFISALLFTGFGAMAQEMKKDSQIQPATTEEPAKITPALAPETAPAEGTKKAKAKKASPAQITPAQPATEGKKIEATKKTKTVETKEAAPEKKS